jgi:antitoxin CptB
MNDLEILKKKILYRSNYRGTKEMDILLSSFVKKNIDSFSESQLLELNQFLNFEDEAIYNYIYKDISNTAIEKNQMSKLLKEFKI